MSRCLGGVCLGDHLFGWGLFDGGMLSWEHSLLGLIAAVHLSSAWVWPSVRWCERDGWRRVETGGACCWLGPY